MIASSEAFTDSSMMTQGSSREEVENLLSPTYKVNKDDFEYIKVIGRGSFGKVYLARKKDSTEPIALKVIRKDKLVENEMLEKAHAERKILASVDCPYIVKLHYAYQSETKLYLAIDFLNGGELFTYLRRERVFEEDRARVYAAELVEAISYLHKNNIIYRDLKPENVLFDSNGHLKITDFGLSKIVKEPTEITKSFCGTPEYIAPEIIQGVGHTMKADWWSLGALLYQMLTGRPPHYNKNKMQMLKDIVDKDVEMRPFLSQEAQSLLQSLLQRDEQKRIGSFVDGAEDDASEIRKHPFFASINWKKLKECSHQAPFKPAIRGREDISLIDKSFT